MSETLWTDADIDTLKAAIASGVLTVSYSGPPARTITYQSTAAMLQVLAEMRAEVANASGTRRRFRYVRVRKGS